MLVDLDDLVSECPDPRSRKYISEAVQCYKAGAYRSSVVACWIALVFDLVDKIREIGAGGDPAAQKAIAKFDRARQDHDVRASLEFEKGLLVLARDKFEFLSQMEFIDLSRLADDRNRCAHPSQVSDTEVFEASPELARLHIINCTKYVLSKPAAQGKAALDRLLADINSRFFPSKLADVKVFLGSGALAKPREALLKNYLIVLLKDLAKQPGIDYERRNRSNNALLALQQMHPEQWKRLMPEILASIIPSLQSDEQLKKASLFFGGERGYRLWPYIGPADRLRLSTFVQNYPGDDLGELTALLEKAELPLLTDAEARIKKASEVEILDNAMWFETPMVLIDRLLSIYKNSPNFASANAFAKKIRIYVLDSKNPEKHFSLLIAAAVENAQVRDSNQFPVLIKDFSEKIGMSFDDLNSALDRAGLQKIE